MHEVKSFYNFASTEIALAGLQGLCLSTQDLKKQFLQVVTY